MLHKQNLNINNKARLLFFAQQHSQSIINFLKPSPEFVDELDYSSEIVDHFEQIIRDIINSFDKGIFDYDALIGFKTILETTPSLINVVNQDLIFVHALIQALPSCAPDQMSIIFEIFSDFIKYSPNLMETLTENNLLIFICNFLVNDKLNDELKISAAECLHCYAKQNNSNALRCFDNIEINNGTKSASPIQCILYVLDSILPNDETSQKISNENQQIFETEPSTEKLKILILKFLVAIINIKNFPNSPNSNEIICELLKYTQQPERYSEIALYGVALIADRPQNSLIYKIFINEIHNLYCLHFLNLLDNSNNEFILNNILLIFKSIIDNNSREWEFLKNINFLNHLFPYISYERSPLVQGNAIETFTSIIIIDPRALIRPPENLNIINILYNFLSDAPYSVKIISLTAFSVILDIFEKYQIPISIPEKYPDIIDRIIPLIGSATHFYELNSIFKVLEKIVEIYRHLQQEETLYEIFEMNDIKLYLENLMLSDDLGVRTQAFEFLTYIKPFYPDIEPDNFNT